MKIFKKFSNVLKINNCDLSAGFHFLFKIVKVLINLRIFFLKYCLKKCHFTNIEFKKILHSYHNSELVQFRFSKSRIYYMENRLKESILHRKASMTCLTWVRQYKL